MIRATWSNWQWQQQRHALADIELLVFDVDGVLTDGTILLDSAGNHYKRFDVRDGLGLRLLQHVGLHLAFLSGGSGGATEFRAKQLGVKHCQVDIKDKPVALEALQLELLVSPACTAFVGDDLNDLAVRNQVRLLLAPADACGPLLSQADAILRANGGFGAVRELAERILRARGDLKAISRLGWRGHNN